MRICFRLTGNLLFNISIHEIMQTALLIIDVQNDYFPGGKNELIGSMDSLYQVKKLLNYFRMKNLPVFHVQHLSNRSSATFFLPDTSGSMIHDNVKPIAGETIIRKHYPNSFRETILNDTLKSMGINQLVICGMMTHMCVDSTIRAAYDLGYICTVADNACATKNLQINNEIIKADIIQKSFMSAFNGLFASVKNTDEVIFSLK